MFHSKKALDLDVNISVQINRRRKHIALCIEEGQVIIKAPRALSKRKTDALVAEHHLWLTTQLAKQVPPNTYEHGSQLLYLGHELRLVDSEDSAQTQLIYQAAQAELLLPATQPFLSQRQTQLRHWYQQQAHDYLHEATTRLVQQTALTPTRLIIKSFKSRWGSCHSDKTIKLNWRLIMAPPVVIDYVIIHELCHLTHMNHSHDFWSLVERYYPDYRIHRLWLKQHGEQLMRTL